MHSVSSSGTPALALATAAAHSASSAEPSGEVPIARLASSTTAPQRAAPLAVRSPSATRAASSAAAGSEQASRKRRPTSALK